MAPVNPKVELERLLNQGDLIAAKALAGELLKRNPRDGEAWLAVARCAIGMDRMRVAEEALARAEKTLGQDHRIAYARAITQHYLGRSSDAAKLLRGLIAKRAPNAIDAHVFLIDVLHRSGARDEMHALIAAGGSWASDPRAAVLIARAKATTDRPAAIAELEAIARGSGSSSMRRNAGFEAVQLLDSSGEFARAWALAQFLHVSTTSPFDVGKFRTDIDLQMQLLERGKPWFEPRVPKVEGIAFITGMPRSGTTLLEQMLDRHSQVAGIGEYEGIIGIASGVNFAGVWPRGLGALPAEEAANLQTNYLTDARTPDVANKKWLVDKSLHTWQWLPAVAAILPGAVCLHVARDPRDTAVSLYLSNFHATNYAWTQSLEGIRVVMEAERKLSLHALQVLGIKHEAIVYEDLVEDPNGHAHRVAKLLGIAPEPGMLTPEANSRTVLTLSHEQVRRPINRTSIGRWANYSDAFSAGWDGLVAIHQERRRGNQ